MTEHVQDMLQHTGNKIEHVLPFIEYTDNISEHTLILMYDVYNTA